MSSSLSNLVDNLSEGLYDDKCTHYKFYFEYISTKDELLIFNCQNVIKSIKSLLINF